MRVAWVVVAAVFSSCATTFAEARFKRALEQPGASALLERREDVEHLRSFKGEVVDDALSAELCAGRYERADAIRGNAAVDSLLARLLRGSACPAGTDVVGVVRGWLALQGVTARSYPLSADLTRLCLASVLPPCPDCPALGSADQVRSGKHVTPVVVRCAVRTKEGNVWAVVSEKEDVALARAEAVRGEDLVGYTAQVERQRQAKLASLLTPEALARRPAWQLEYLPPPDAPDRMRALTPVELAEYRMVLQALIDTTVGDPQVLTHYQPYVLGARLELLKLLRDLDPHKASEPYAASSRHFRTLRTAFLKECPLPTRMAALRSLGRFFFPRVGYSGAVDVHGGGALPGGTAEYFETAPLRRDLEALQQQALSAGHVQTAQGAAHLLLVLDHPVGLDPQLAALMLEARAKSISPSMFAWFDLPFEGQLSIPIEQAAAVYALAPIKVRLIDSQQKNSSERRSYQSLSVRERTAADQQSDATMARSRASLQFELAELDARIERLSGATASSSAPKGVVEYRCDPGTGLNCRAVTQGGGESASGYIARRRAEAEIAQLEEQRSEVRQKLSALRAAPAASAYEKTTKSEVWLVNSSRLELELETPSYGTERVTLGGEAKAAPATASWNRQATPEQLSMHVLTRLLSDLNKRIEAEIARLQVEPPKVPANPVDDELEACMKRTTGAFRLAGCLADSNVSSNVRQR